MPFFSSVAAMAESGRRRELAEHDDAERSRCHRVCPDGELIGVRQNGAGRELLPRKGVGRDPPGDSFVRAAHRDDPVAPHGQRVMSQALARRPHLVGGRLPGSPVVRRPDAAPTLFSGRIHEAVCDNPAAHRKDTVDVRTGCEGLIEQAPLGAVLRGPYEPTVLIGAVTVHPADEDKPCAAGDNRLHIRGVEDPQVGELEVRAHRKPTRARRRTSTLRRRCGLSRRDPIRVARWCPCPRSRARCRDPEGHSSM